MEFAKVSAITFVSVLAPDVLDKGSLLVGLLSSRRSPTAAVTIPFPPMPARPAAPNNLGWTAKWEPKFKVRAAVDLIDSLAVDASSSVLTLRISPKSYKHGGPGALVMDVATFWAPTGRDDIV